MLVRPTTAADIPDIIKILETTEIFPPEYLPEMLNPFLSDPDCVDSWLSCELNSIVVGFCYAVPEKLTEGTFNLLAIAVLSSQQRSGSGAALLEALELRLSGKGGRLLIVDTSGSDEFERARKFYRKNNYCEEARIRDFWAEGDDKVIFTKKISSSKK